MVDSIELSDGFVRAVLEDNARLRAENDGLRADADPRRLLITETNYGRRNHYRLIDESVSTYPHETVVNPPIMEVGHG